MITPGFEIQLHPSRQYEIYKDHEYRENLKKVTTHYRKPRSPGDIFTPKKTNENNHQLILHPIRQMEIMREKNMAVQLHPTLKNIEVDNEKEEQPREPIRIMSNKERRFRQFVINDKFQTLN
eukprot:jgi/Orpsp1_1/1186859/evm.model.d7180000053699.1